jgi:O-antigen biosynthesis protein
MARVLACNSGWVRPDMQSGDRRFASMLEIIQSHFGVDLLMSGVGDDPDPAKLQPLRTYFKGNLLADGWRGTEAALYSRPYDCCLVEFWPLAEKLIPEIRRSFPWTRVVVDSVDVHFAREEAAAALGLLDAKAVAARKNRELAAYRAADAVIAVTDEDERVLRAAGIDTPIHVIPNILPSQRRPEINRQSEILFIGGFKHPPNEDGILWFVRECWTQIRSAVPDAHLTIVGSNPPESVLHLTKTPGIDVVGYVPTTETYLARAAVSIAPLRYGGGMKGKVCEALASGVPLVTTSAGAQGLQLQNGHGARVHDTPREFAGAVIWALSDRKSAEAMAADGQRIVDAACGVNAVSARIVPMVQSLTSRPTAAQLASWRLRSLRFSAQVLARQLALACGARSFKRLMQSSPAQSSDRLAIQPPQ